jgi:hypothetical protein
VDGGGLFMVVIDCAAEAVPIEVTVHEGGGRRELGTFDVACSGAGTITSEFFETSSYEGVLVQYQTRFGQWVALSILVPHGAINP